MCQGTVVALLTRKVDERRLAFLEEVASLGHRVFIIPDESDHGPSVRNSVHIVDVDEAACARSGFRHLNPVITHRTQRSVSSWEKGLYYFATQDVGGEHVWFIEDDVFVPVPTVFSDIDEETRDADLVSAPASVNMTGELDGWYWWRYVPRRLLPPPWSQSLVCAVRLSRPLLGDLAEFLKRNTWKRRLLSIFSGQQYFFIEFLFHTIALKKKRKVSTTSHFSGITWSVDWNPAEMQRDVLYHPVKDPSLHPVLWRSFGRGNRPATTIARGRSQKTPLKLRRARRRSG